jgi:hypothetical protein
MNSPMNNIRIEEHEINDSMHIIVNAEQTDFAEAFLESEKKITELIGRGWFSCGGKYLCGGQNIPLMDAYLHLPKSLYTALNRSSFLLDANWVYFAKDTPLWVVSDWFDKEFHEVNLVNSLAKIDNQHNWGEVNNKQDSIGDNKIPLHFPNTLMKALNRKSLLLEHNWFYFAMGTPLWFIADWFDANYVGSNMRGLLSKIEKNEIKEKKEIV